MHSLFKTKNILSLGGLFLLAGCLNTENTPNQPASQAEQSEKDPSPSDSENPPGTDNPTGRPQAAPPSNPLLQKKREELKQKADQTLQKFLGDPNTSEFQAFLKATQEEKTSEAYSAFQQTPVGKSFEQERQIMKPLLLQVIRTVWSRLQWIRISLISSSDDASHQALLSQISIQTLHSEKICEGADEIKAEIKALCTSLDKLIAHQKQTSSGPTKIDLFFRPERSSSSHPGRTWTSLAIPASEADTWGGSPLLELSSSKRQTNQVESWFSDQIWKNLKGNGLHQHVSLLKYFLTSFQQEPLLVDQTTQLLETLFEKHPSGSEKRIWIHALKQKITKSVDLIYATKELLNLFLKGYGLTLDSLDPSFSFLAVEASFVNQFAAMAQITSSSDEEALKKGEKALAELEKGPSLKNLGTDKRKQDLEKACQKIQEEAEEISR